MINKIDEYLDIPMVTESPHSELYLKLDRVLKWVERGIIPFEDGIDRMHYLIGQAGGARCGMNMVKVNE